MGRRITDVYSEQLAGLGVPCASCLFWESVAARQGPALDVADAVAGNGSAAPPDGADDVGRNKVAWWQATQLEWGPPGKLLAVDGETAGFAAYGPAENYPRIRRQRRAPSDDALLLASLWIVPEHRGRGHGKALLHAVLRETVRHHSRALEAYAARGLADAGQTCYLPEGFLLAIGFEVHHDDPLHPLLRLDLRKTVRWQESFGLALEGVRLALVRRERRAPARPALEVQRQP